MLKVKRLGNGGAFNFEDTNSSFLISLNDNHSLLFDCGYSVYSKLRLLDNQKEIDLSLLKTVFISHMDDDHMGSLKTLILYMFFVKNITLKISCPREVYNDLSLYLSDIKGVMTNYVVIPTKMFDLKWSSSFMLDDVYLEVVKAKHNKECSGLYFNSNDDLNLFISGDTVADKSIKTFLTSKTKPVLIFHDFSNWNSPSSQIHACKDNISFEYGYKLSNRLNYYHNDASYLQDWFNLSLSDAVASNYLIYSSFYFKDSFKKLFKNIRNFKKNL